MDTLLELRDLGFAWPGQAELLDIPQFSLGRGETLFLKGPSGSGKTTLLGLLGGVQKPRRGSIRLLGEDLAQLYADLHGIDTVSIRIGSCFPEPTTVRMLSVWMSPADGARLLHAALTAEAAGHTVVYGSSANTRLWWDLAPARALGYDPQDDSEAFAPALLAAQGPLDPADPAHANLGGAFCTDPPRWPH